MKSLDAAYPSHDIPEIIQAVLIQAARMRAEGAITERQLASQIKRLIVEDLLPRGLSLVHQNLDGGSVRFLLKDRAGAICHIVDCPASVQRAAA